MKLFHCKGGSVGIGWQKLVEPLLIAVERDGGEVLQVKEKFGGLRFYCAGVSEETQKAIDEAERASTSICEACGEPGKPRQPRYWIKTLCDECSKENK